MAPLNKPHSLLPPTLTPTFLGRSSDLHALETLLHPATPKPTPHYILLHGPSGIGKSQLALQYATTQRSSYHSVFFISAPTPLHVLLAYRSICDELGLPWSKDEDVSQKVEQVREWFEKEEGWLVVFDGVGYEHFVHDIVLKGKGDVVVTTRSTAVVKRFRESGLGDVVVGVEALGEGDAVDLLLRAGGLEGGDEECRRVAKSFVEKVGCIPGALEFVEKGCKNREAVQRMLEVLKRPEAMRDELRRKAEQSVGSLDATLLRCVFEDRVSQLEEQEKELYYITAFLDPSCVSAQLFRELPNEENETLQNLAADAEATKKRLRYLEELGLVNRSNVTEDEYWIPNAIHEIHQSELTASEALSYKDFAARWILAAFPDEYEEYATWVDGPQYLKHAVFCSSQHPHLNPLSLGRLLYHASNLARSLGLYSYAESLAEDSERAFEDSPDSPDLQDALLARESLALAVVERGKWTRAEHLLRQNLAYQERHFGNLHALTLRTVHELGWLYVLSGKPEVGEAWLLRAVAGRKEALGEESEALWCSWEKLAACYAKMEKAEEAEAFYALALEGRMKRHGAESVEVLDIQFKVVELKESRNELKEAAHLCREVWEGMKKLKMMGPTHPDTLLAANKLVSLLDTQGLFGEALDVGEACLQACNEKFGDTDERTARVRGWVADVIEADMNTDNETAKGVEPSVEMI